MMSLWDHYFTFFCKDRNLVLVIYTVEILHSSQFFSSEKTLKLRTLAPSKQCWFIPASMKPAVWSWRLDDLLMHHNLATRYHHIYWKTGHAYCYKKANRHKTRIPEKKQNSVVANGDFFSPLSAESGPEWFLHLGFHLYPGFILLDVFKKTAAKLHCVMG